MSWIYLTVLAYLINAISFIIDKYLLSSPIPRPFAYAFWVSVLSVSALFLIPFGVHVPTVQILGIAFLSGAMFFGALLFFYRAVKKSDASVVSTKVGAFTAGFTYILSYAVLHERLTTAHGWAILFLVAGIYILGKTRRSIFPLDIYSGFLFAFSLVLLKFTFGSLDYVNAIFWTRIGFVLVALMSLAFSQARHEIRASFASAPRASKVLLVFNKALVAIGFLILYYAIQLGNVAVVNALMGLQFLFVFLLALILRRYIPSISEYIDRGSLIRKIAGIALVGIGFLIVIQ